MSRMFLGSGGHNALITVLEIMAVRCASSLLAILPVALRTGYAEVVPELEPLMVQ